MATLRWPQVLGWRMKRQFLEQDRVAGFWEATNGKIDVTPFEPLPAEALRAEVERVTALL
jgi:hypothetical protein